MIILPTRQAIHIGRKLEDLKKENDSLASELDMIWLGTNNDGKIEFPDREIYTTISGIEKIDGEDVVVLHCGAPRPNSSTLRLFQALDSLNNPQDSRGKKETVDGTIKDYGPHRSRSRSKGVFFLYPAYGMQDWPDKKGSINAIKGILDICMQMYGVDRFFTIDAHFAGEDWTRDYPLKNVSALPMLMEKAESQGYRDMIIIGPDEGTMRRNGLRGLKKKRLDSYNTKAEICKELADELEGKHVGMADDVLETGGTMFRAGEVVRRCNPERLGALITHMRLEQGYVRLIEGPFDNVYVTNTIDNAYASVNVAPLVADTLKKHF
jgi:phosphoribosylpyrophosphate synthetase